MGYVQMIRAGYTVGEAKQSSAASDLDKYRDKIIITSESTRELTGADEEQLREAVDDFFRHDKEYLLSLKEQGWDTSIRAERAGFGPPREYDHLSIGFTAEESRYIASSEENRQRLIDAVKAMTRSSSGAQKSAIIIGPHVDTSNTHVHVLLHRFAVDKDNRRIEVADDLSKRSNATQFLDRLNKELEARGLPKMQDFRLQDGKGLMLDVSRAEAKEAVAKQIESAGGISTMRANADIASVAVERESLIKLEAQARADAERMQLEIQRLQAEQQAAIERVTLAQQAQAALAERDELKAQVESVTQERDQLKEQLDNVMQERDQLAQQNDLLTQKSLEQQSEIETLREENSNVKQELESVTQERDELAKENETLKEQSSKQQSELETLRAENASVIQERDELAAQNEALNEALREQLAQERERHERELAEMREQLAQERERHERELAEMRAMLRELRDLFQSMQALSQAQQQVQPQVQREQQVQPQVQREQQVQMVYAQLYADPRFHRAEHGDRFYLGYDDSGRRFYGDGRSVLVVTDRHGVVMAEIGDKDRAQEVSRASGLTQKLMAARLRGGRGRDEDLER